MFHPAELIAAAESPQGVGKREVAQCLQCL